MVADVTPGAAGRGRYAESRTGRDHPAARPAGQRRRDLARGPQRRAAGARPRSARRSRTGPTCRSVSLPTIGALTRLIESAETLEGFASGLTGLDRTGAGAATDSFQTATNLPLPGHRHGTAPRRRGRCGRHHPPGLIIATAPRALVTTPWRRDHPLPGPLLDYGNVIILEPADQHLLVLAGLDQVYGECRPGAARRRSGRADGRRRAAGDAFLTQGGDDTGAERSETLYMELRQDGQPVNPANWFALE